MYIVQIAATISIRGRMGGPRDASGRPLMYVGIPGNYWREQACVTVIGITIQPLFPLFAGVSNDTPSPSSAPFLPSNPPATIAQVCNAHAPIYTDFHRFRESSPLQQQKLSLIFIPRGINSRFLLLRREKMCVQPPKGGYPPPRETNASRTERGDTCASKKRRGKSGRHPEVRLLSRAAYKSS